MSHKPQETALDRYIREHPEACEISFRAGWYAGAHHERAVRRVDDRKTTKGHNHAAWRQDITDKYTEAKRLVEKGCTKKEACEMVGLAYDNYMRRQRLEIFGRDRFEQ